MAPALPSPTHRLWGALRRPCDVAEAVDAVLGLSPAVARQLAGTLTATSVEAERLLATMPTTVRSLSITVTTHAEECRGELRGPILWSETMSRRAGSPAGAMTYVCATPQRAYDTLENRVLAAALLAVRDAGASVEGMSANAYDDDTMRRARHNSARARRFLDHRTMQGVAHEQPTKRALRRARSGSRRNTYEPALAMLDRVADPLTADDILPFCDRRTRVQHELLMAVVDTMAERGNPPPSFRPIDGALKAGDLRYNHPRRRGDRELPHGIQIGGVLIDVPDRIRERHRDRAQHHLAQRAGDLEAAIVLERGDLERALDLALDRDGLARRPVDA